MEAAEILRELTRANHHKGGLKIQKLFKVSQKDLNNIREEVVAMIKEHAPSDVKAAYHVTNWTKPFGDAIQFSLYNRSGRMDDTSDDHRKYSSGKSNRFHYQAEYPTIGAFISSFPSLLNMRLNGMGPSGGLSPHEEQLPYRQGSKVILRARFHLPIFTNLRAEVLLDGEFFHLEAGFVYLFNNGCIHSAINNGDESRYHLVWDMVMTTDALACMFAVGDYKLPHILQRVPEDQQQVTPTRRWDGKEYIPSGISAWLYRTAHLEKFVGSRIKPYHIQNIVNEVDYLRHRYLSTPVVANDE